MNTVEQIKKNLSILPVKDQKISLQCIEQGDYDRLFELVSADHIRMTKLLSLVTEYVDAHSYIPDESVENDLFCDDAFNINI